MLDLLNGNYYTVKTDQDTSGFTWGSTDTDVKFYQMQGASWDDPRWDDLLSQMTREEAWVLAANAGDSIPSVESAGLHEQKITVNAGNGLDEIARTYGIVFLLIAAIEHLAYDLSRLFKTDGKKFFILIADALFHRLLCLRQVIRLHLTKAVDFRFRQIFK